MLGYHTLIYHYIQVHTFCHEYVQGHTFCFEYVLGHKLFASSMYQVHTRGKRYILEEKVHTRREKYILWAKSTYFSSQIPVCTGMYQYILYYLIVYCIPLIFEGYIRVYTDHC
jgi:hypothetical protein